MKSTERPADRLGSSRLHFLRANRSALLTWSAFCLLMITLACILILARLDDQRRTLEKEALQDAASLARGYGDYLKRSVEQLDQITLLIKHQWEDSHDSPRLRNMLSNGALLNADFTLIAIIDRNGMPITGMPDPANTPSVADREYFQYHRAHPDAVLHIGKLVTGRITGKRVMQLTRRLQDKEGNFDGVVLVSIEPAWFGAFHNDAYIGKSSLLAVIGDDGLARMAGVRSFGHADVSLAAVPELAGRSGTSILPGTPWFADRRARFVAWEPVAGYPLKAIVGLVVDERLDTLHATERSYWKIAAASALLLLAFSVGVTWLWWRNEWQHYLHAEAQDAYRITTEGGLDGFYSLQPIMDEAGSVVDFKVIDCNERGAFFNGIPVDEFIGSTLAQRYPKPYFFKVLATFCEALDKGFYEDELKIPPQSPVRLEWVHRRLVRTRTGLAMTVRDISQVKAHERELWRTANEDALTALPNRHWLKSTLPDVIAQARSQHTRVAVLFVDLDDFKNVNDSLGHSAGDELLQIAAKRLQSVLRPGDNVVRLGGDEFTVILTNLEDRHAAAQVAQRITDAFAQPFVLRNGTDSVGTSIGVSVFPDDGDDVETLLMNSDIAMYHAKALGKNHFQFYEPALGQVLTQRRAIERDLQRAIAEGQFIMMYQPRVDALSGQLRGLEALVRWQHPERGLLAPQDFIALAEETGLIVRLGEIIAAQVCAQLAVWREAGLPLVPLSINVSPRQFNQGNIHALFAELLSSHQIGPGLIEIEITESSMMGRQEELAQELRAIRALGIKMLVDDFGTGYSSLSQLQRLDMDGLKVDRAFTDELGKNAEGEVFFRAIVSMAHALGMTVVAEGVESVVQLRLLQLLECDEIQGYFIARPLPVEAIPDLLRQPRLLPDPQQGQILLPT